VRSEHYSDNEIIVG